jgi:formimidoylglutamate deiminase
LEPGALADFFTVDLNDPSIAGASRDDLLANIVFSMSRSAIKDVVVGGQQIIEGGRHLDQDEITGKFNDLQARLWN